MLNKLKDFKLKVVGLPEYTNGIVTRDGRVNFKELDWWEDFFTEFEDVSVDGNKKLVLRDVSGVYKTSGYRVSKAIPLGSIQDVGNSLIEWEETKDEDTDVNIYTKLNPAVVDDFESYSAGSLSGQGNWSGSSQIQLVTSGGYNNPKCAHINGDANWRTVSRTINKVNSGIFSIYYKKYFQPYSGNDQGSALQLLSGATTIADVFFNINYATPTIEFKYAGGSVVLAANQTRDVWYKVSIEIDLANSRVRAKADLTTSTPSEWCAWQTLSADYAFVDKIQIRAYTTSYQRWDDIEYRGLGEPEDTWQEATNGQPIPGISTGDDLTGKELYIKQELTTSNTNKTPTVLSVSGEIESA